VRNEFAGQGDKVQAPGAERIVKKEGLLGYPVFFLCIAGQRLFCERS